MILHLLLLLTQATLMGTVHTPIAASMRCASRSFRSDSDERNMVVSMSYLLIPSLYLRDREIGRSGKSTIDHRLWTLPLSVPGALSLVVSTPWLVTSQGMGRIRHTLILISSHSSVLHKQFMKIVTLAQSRTSCF